MCQFFSNTTLDQSARILYSVELEGSVTPGSECESTVVYTGAFGSFSWLDMERGLGGYVAIDDYDSGGSREVHAVVRQHIIPLQQQAADEARAAATGP